METMADPIRATDRQLREAIIGAYTQAWGYERHNTRDHDGHCRAGVRSAPGVRISVRVNRHGRTEISVSRPQQAPLTQGDLDRISDIHRDAQGSILTTAYTEPADAMRLRAPFVWAVMHVAADNAQPALLRA
jgi:hypothetical protein